MIEVDCDGAYEVHVMLEQRVEQRNAAILEPGRAQGLADGRQEAWKKGWREGWLQGWREGRQEVRREIAQAMIQQTDIADATIADPMRLSLDQIQALRTLPSPD